MNSIFKKNRIWIIFTLLIITLITFALFYYVNLVGNEASNPLLKDIQQHASPELNVRALQGDRSFWITDDGYMVGVTNQSGLRSHFQGTIVDSQTEDKIDELSRYAIQVLINGGYAIDPVNSSDSADLAPFYSERTALKNRAGDLCSVEPSPSGNPVWYLPCISAADLAAAYEIQQPFLNALGNPKDVAAIPTEEGSYARVVITNGQGGYYAMMKKVNEEWTVVFKGQDTPSCEQMNQNDIPRSIYEQCS